MERQQRLEFPDEISGQLSRNRNCVDVCYRNIDTNWVLAPGLGLAPRLGLAPGLGFVTGDGLCTGHQAPSFKRRVSTAATAELRHGCALRRSNAATCCTGGFDASIRELETASWQLIRRAPLNLVCAAQRERARREWAGRGRAGGAARGSDASRFSNRTRPF